MSIVEEGRKRGRQGSRLIPHPPPPKMAANSKEPEFGHQFDYSRNANHPRSHPAQQASPAAGSLLPPLHFGMDLRHFGARRPWSCEKMGTRRRGGDLVGFERRGEGMEEKEGKEGGLGIGGGETKWQGSGGNGG
jgi:hypothetical protein